MSHTVLDHLVVAAATLEEGAAWCEATLGVTVGAIGKHPLMGTHNHVLKLGGDAHVDAYLEIIAIDPQAAPPGRPRWFGLDTLDLSTGPRLVHLVARSTMLDMHRWGLITVGLHPGDPMKFSRETAAGTLQWEMLVRPDGQPLCGGALPTLIQWHSFHPAPRLPETGLVLEDVTLAGVPPRAREVLRLRGVAWADDGPAIRATLQTPRGDVMLTTTP